MQNKDDICEILLVEDNPGDIIIFKTALNESDLNHKLVTISNGEEVMEYLQNKINTLPKLIILDLNLPRKDGKEILAEIKNDPVFCIIPVIVLTSSEADSDIYACYKLNANCYIPKPRDLDKLMEMVKVCAKFWGHIVAFPPESYMKKNSY